MNSNTNCRVVVTNKTSGAKVTVKQSDLCQEAPGCVGNKKQCLEISVLSLVSSTGEAP